MFYQLTEVLSCVRVSFAPLNFRARRALNSIIWWIRSSLSVFGFQKDATVVIVDDKAMSVVMIACFASGLALLLAAVRNMPTISSFQTYR